MYFHAVTAGDVADPGPKPGGRGRRQDTQDPSFPAHRGPGPDLEGTCAPPRKASHTVLEAGFTGATDPGVLRLGCTRNSCPRRNVDVRGRRAGGTRSAAARVGWRRPLRLPAPDERRPARPQQGSRGSGREAVFSFSRETRLPREPRLPCGARWGRCTLSTRARCRSASPGSSTSGACDWSLADPSGSGATQDGGGRAGTG